MTTNTKTSAKKRTELKQKIEAAEKRNADRSFGDYARGARDGATSFVKEHPIATVAGGLVLGAIVASFLPGKGRKLRKKASARSALMAGGAEKAAKAGQDRASDLGDTLGDGVRSAGKTASRTISDLRSRFH